MSESIVVAPGRYRHYKGNEYRVIGLARHSETREVLVVYQALYGERGTSQLLVLSQVILSMQLPFAVIPLIVYPYAKRFTDYPHAVLGLAQSIAPIGAWVGSPWAATPARTGALDVLCQHILGSACADPTTFGDGRLYGLP